MIEDYKKGKKNALAFLVGQVMKETKGKANPKMVNELLILKRLAFKFVTRFMLMTSFPPIFLHFLLETLNARPSSEHELKVSSGLACLRKRAGGTQACKPVRRRRPARPTALCIQNSAESPAETPAPSPVPSGMYKQYTCPGGRSLPNIRGRTSMEIACRHTSTWPE